MLHYRVNPKDATELQWSKKPFGPGTQWQHAMSFRKPIRALDIDDTTQQGVVVLNDSSTYVGSGVRKWGRKFYPAGTRIFSLYAVGESKENSMKKCSMQKKMESLKKEGNGLFVFNTVAIENPLMDETGRFDMGLLEAINYYCEGLSEQAQAIRIGQILDYYKSNV